MDQHNPSHKAATIRLIMDYLHRTMMHHAMWYSEVKHQFGQAKAMEIMDQVYRLSYDLQSKRLAKILGVELKEGIPEPLMALPGSQLAALKEGVAINWLANDGVWFQAVEKMYGMFDAKRCNDSCWGQFSPLEAWSVKRLLNLPDNPGLEGLKQALQYRLYAAVNVQEIAEETENSFVFRMVDCRVQSARRRKGLEDYPCKSAGIIEYRSFAETIDPRITTECIACPPDTLERNWFCGWKFTLSS